MIELARSSECGIPERPGNVPHEDFARVSELCALLRSWGGDGEEIVYRATDCSL